MSAMLQARTQQQQHTAYYRESVHIPLTDEAIAIAALGCLGGPDIAVASVLMSLCEHGWGLWEEEVRLLGGGTLPSWLISSLRGGMRSELVLCSYGMSPRHGELLGVGISRWSRIQRLVLMGNRFGCQGAAGIAIGLSCGENDVTELVLDKCGIGCFGAAALASMLTSRHCRLAILQLEENHIHDAGGQALAAAIRSKTGNTARGVALLLGGNCMTSVACSELSTACEENPAVSVRLANRFYANQRPAQGAMGSEPPRAWRLFATRSKRVEPPPKLPRMSNKERRRKA